MSQTSLFGQSAWKQTTLGDAFYWGSGGTPSSGNATYYDGDIPWAIIADLTDGPVYETKRSITREGLKNSSAKLVEPGSVLLAMYGSIGKLGITKIPLATNQAIAFTHPKCCSAEFLFYYLLHSRHELTLKGKGGTQQNISQGVIKAFPFHFPEDTEEQNAIVAEIEKQFSRLDAGIAALKRAQANLKRYRASVLQAAFAGALIEPNTEHWEMTKLGQAATVVGGLTKNPKRAKMPIQHPYLRVANVYANQLRLDEIEYIGVEERELTKLLVRKNDLLIVEGNGSKDQIGRVAIWDGSIDNCVHQNHLIKARPKEGVSPKWMLFWLLSPGGRYAIEKVSSSTSGLYTLSVGKVSSLPLPVIAFSAQEAIVAEVERLLSVADAVEASIEQQLARATRLRQSILAKAFSGGDLA